MHKGPEDKEPEKITPIFRFCDFLGTPWAFGGVTGKSEFV